MDGPMPNRIAIESDRGHFSLDFATVTAVMRQHEECQVFLSETGLLSHTFGGVTETLQVEPGDITSQFVSWLEALHA